MNPLLINYLALLFLAAAAVQDMATRRISNFWPLLIFALYVVRLLLMPETFSWLDAVGSLAVFAVGLTLWRFRLMGGGDVKILAAVCLLLGMSAIPIFLAYVCIAGGIIAAIIILLRTVRRRFLQANSVDQVHSGIPYAPAAALGWIATWLLPT